MRRGPNKIIMILLICMAGLMVYQLYSAIKPVSHQQDPAMMLHQVSVFQLELLNSFLAEASVARSADDLNSLKQAVYSAQYTHEKLILAVGEQKLSKLSSVSDLMQYILRLQIGGDRPLDEQEIIVFQEVHESFKQLYNTYKTLFSAKGEIITSQKQKLEELDLMVSDNFKNKGLE
jgi:hypothetical protein